MVICLLILEPSVILCSKAQSWLLGAKHWEVQRPMRCCSDPEDFSSNTEQNLSVMGLECSRMCQQLIRSRNKGIWFCCRRGVTSNEKEQRAWQLLTWTLKDRRTFPEGGGGGGWGHSHLRKRGEQRLGDKRRKTKQRGQQRRISKCLQFIPLWSVRFCFKANRGRTFHHTILCFSDSSHLPQWPSSAFIKKAFVLLYYCLCALQMVFNIILSGSFPICSVHQCINSQT